MDLRGCARQHQGSYAQTKRGHETLIAIENEPSAGNAPIDGHDYATTRVLKSRDKIAVHRNFVGFEVVEL
jgi:hypothetical protein